MTRQEEVVRTASGVGGRGLHTPVLGDGLISSNRGCFKDGEKGRAGPAVAQLRGPRNEAGPDWRLQGKRCHAILNHALGS